MQARYSRSVRYRSTSMAAAQPWPAAVTALWLKWICHISGGEHSGQARLGASPLDQVAVGIHFDFSFKWARVRRMADGDENAFHLQIRQRAGFDILELDGFSFPLLIR